MKINLAPKHWAVIAFSVLVLTVILFNDSFRQTVSRRKAVRQTQAEIESISAEVEVMKHKIAEIEQDASVKETMVRSELGYLRPGEKEVRFLDRNKNSHGQNNLR